MTPIDIGLSLDADEIELSIEESYIGSAYSPQVDINETESGHEIEITYKAPEGLTTKSFEVPDKDWQKAEDARAQAESARVQAESGRVSAEDTRASAEAARVSAEASRVQAESSRATEWQTMSHDMQEATADATHAADETNAFLQEAMGNEAQRVSAEQTRIASEASRASAERRRRTDETARAEAESERAIDESGRVAAERARAQAEASRQQNESARVQSWDTLSSGITSATQSANQAASDARSAASTATQATTDTRQATSAADTAAANARLATANASQATSDANQATQAATQATEQADQATTNANQAAQSATTATTNANAATESASAAASAANAAAVTANQEAEGASAAAELANAATTAATNATQAATTATTAANQATATANDAAERAEDAIEAIGDISELAVPLMSADVRGGAKLGEGLEIRDGALTISTEANESTGEVHGSIASLTAKGWAEQDTSTQGKNLLDVVDGDGVEVSGSTIVVTGNYRDLFTKTLGHTANVDDLSTVPLLPTGTFTLSCGKTSGSTVILYGVDVDGTTYIIDKSAAASTGWTKTFTLEEPTHITVRSTSSTITELQLELGSTATEYEPFVPDSPSPDYPAEIMVARGRNLIDKNDLVQYYIGPDGIAVASAGSLFATDYLPVIAGESYAASGLMADWENSYPSFAWYDASKQFISSISYNNVRSRGTIVAPDNAAYIRVTVPLRDTQFQLELGSNPTPYVPYGYVGVEVQSKKNLWGGEFLVRNASASTLGKNSYGRYAVIGENPRYTLCEGPFKPNTAYTFVITAMRRATAHRHTEMNAIYTDGSSAYIDFPTTTAVNAIETFAFVTNPAKTLRKISQDNGFSGSNLLYYDESGIFEGSHSKDVFEPYFHEVIPIPLPSKGYAAALPDGTADTLSVDGAGKWEWECKIAEMDLGTRTWTKSASSTVAVANNAMPSGISGATGVNKLLCSHYPSLPTDTSMGGYDYALTLQVRARNLWIRDADYTLGETFDAAAFKTHVTGAILLYPLATPTTESGYTESPMPSIPSEATVTCPELDDLGVTYLIGDDVRAMAEQWYARAKAEYEQRLEDLEAAVSELMTNG